MLYFRMASPEESATVAPKDTSKAGSSASYGSYGRGQAADECAECTATSKHIQMRKYCEMDYVYLVSAVIVAVGWAQLL